MDADAAWERSSRSSPSGELDPLAIAESLCRDRFRLPGLRPAQREVLAEVLAGHDCLAVLPTGAGKSLCYAIPAAMQRGIVLVISPLIALIRDQAARLRASGLRCVALDSHQSQEERAEDQVKLASAELDILLVSPERLARSDFQMQLAQLPIALVAVDEAHCVSSWGLHFRPDYRFLGDNLKSLFSGKKRPPFLALTATAPRHVREDVERGLSLVAPKTVMGSVARSNLKIRVLRSRRVADQMLAILHAVLDEEGQGIVYAPTRKTALEAWRMLRDAKVDASLYHAGLLPAERMAAQRSFVNGTTRVTVATSAFGMGIDKPDIRFVHHYGLPGSLEQYVQEIGRAGRDGEAARCLMSFVSRDFHVQKFMIEKSHPEEHVLRAATETVAFLTDGPGHVSFRTAALELAARASLKPAAAEAALTLLAREGVLESLRRPGGGMDEMLLGPGHAQIAAAFWNEYPSRKEVQLAKLNALMSFASDDEGRLSYLDQYFRA